MRRRLTVLTFVLGGAVLTAGVAIALASTGTPRYPTGRSTRPATTRFSRFSTWRPS
jgi:hypothetical protein